MVEKKTYNHSLKNLMDACGMTQARWKEVSDIIGKAFEKHQKKSEMVEAIESALSKHELALIAGIWAMEQWEKEQVLRSMMSGMGVLSAPAFLKRDQKERDDAREVA